MAAIRAGGDGRETAQALSERVQLLLSLVKDDDFLSDVLKSAQKTMQDRKNLALSQNCDHSILDTQGSAPLEERARVPLGASYHAAKKRALESRRDAHEDRSQGLSRWKQ